MNEKLAARLADENAREGAGTLHADDRETCHRHSAWVADCAGEAFHTHPVTCPCHECR